MSGVQQPVYAILPAGGTGQRFTSSIPKQYTSLIGQPLVLYTLRVLHRISWIEKVYLALSPKWVSYVEDLIEENNLGKVEIVKGGATRHASIRNCVTAITMATELGQEGSSSTGSPIVILHDAVRPFVEEETYREVVRAAAEYRASGCICTLVSTVLSVTEDGFMDRALKRSEHRASNTPQAFTFEVIRTAYENISADDLAEGTEALDLARKYCGVKAKLVPAPDEVQKVTRRKDIFAAEALAREQSINALVVCQPGAPNGLASQVCETLQSRRVKVHLGEAIPDISDKGSINAAVLILDQISESLSLTDHFPAIQEALGLLSYADIEPSLSVVLRCQQDVSKPEFSELREFCRGLRHSPDSPQAWLHVVLWADDQKEGERARMLTRDRVSKLVAGLVFDRNPHMSGQIFTLP